MIIKAPALKWIGHETKAAPTIHFFTIISDLILVTVSVQLSAEESMCLPTDVCFHERGEKLTVFSYICTLFNTCLIFMTEVIFTWENLLVSVLGTIAFCFG